MDDDVLGLDRGEAIARKLADSLGKAGCIRRELQIGAIRVDQGIEVTDPKHIAALGNDRIHATQLATQHVGEFVGHARFQLQPDHPPAPPPLDGVGEIADQILRLFLDLDIAVA